MALKVIGTGFGRTGTDSMREALNMLGFGPCHHMFEVMANEEQKQLWRALAQGAAPDWERLFAGYTSCMDWPSAHYWPELIKAYPDAKVILTYRSPESWWASVEKTLLPVFRQSTDPNSLGLALIAKQVFGGRPDDRAHAIAVYEANVAAVKATVPAQRLLVHGLGDGWEPLCAHLGVAVPDVPYPSRNSASEFQATGSKS
ncbi:MAG: sulfotransferase family protein [Rhizobiales bacterium]|nr:sulfotransferase family protein [Hyphomicrobiales bacterium]MBI3674420.1 sulfotransferase family protein [Hyphomicrobiales bacterium]